MVTKTYKVKQLYSGQEVVIPNDSRIWTVDCRVDSDPVSGAMYRLECDGAKVCVPRTMIMVKQRTCTIPNTPRYRWASGPVNESL